MFRRLLGALFFIIGIVSITDSFNLKPLATKQAAAEQGTPVSTALFNFNASTFIKKYNDSAQRLKLQKTLVGHLSKKIKIQKGLQNVYSHMFSKYLGIVITTDKTSQKVVDLTLIGQARDIKTYDHLKNAYEIMIKACAPQLTNAEREQIIYNLGLSDGSSLVRMLDIGAFKRRRTYKGVLYSLDFSDSIGFLCGIAPSSSL